MFCMECGSKLNEQAKFCHSCGSKIQPIMEIKDIPLEDGEKDNVFVDNIENADENQDFDSIEDVDENEDFELEIKEQIQRMEEAFLEIFTDVVNKERNLSFVHFEDAMRGKDREFLEELAIDLDVSDTCIYFKYSDKEGFLITTEQIIGYYDNFGLIIYNFGIDDLVCQKKILANVLCVYLNGEMEEKYMYLTGIEDCIDFVDSLNTYGKMHDEILYGKGDDEEEIESYLSCDEIKSNLKNALNQVKELIQEKHELNDKRIALGLFSKNEKEKLDNKIRSINEDIGSIVTFGKYKQNNDKKEPIQWIPVYVTEDYAILLSLRGLDHKAFNNDQGCITWDKCSLRDFLNNEFLQEAFNEQERCCIRSYEINDCLGEATSDKVFLLSKNEAIKFMCKAEISVKPTQYACCGSLGIVQDVDCEWWLRSSPFWGCDCAEIGRGKSFSSYPVESKKWKVVRPAICVSLI